VRPQAVPHGKELFAAAREDGVFAAQRAQDHPAILQLVEWNASFQIGFGRIF
jgi:hypothetical protein